MAKRIALLISLVMMFSISCVLATDVSVDTASSVTEVEDTQGTLPDEEIAGEDSETSGEVVSGEADVLDEGNIDSVDENVNTDDTDDTTTPNDDTATDDEKSGSSAVVGAIIAVVIVVALVAIVALTRKK